jgi:hypothetical protein
MESNFAVRLVSYAGFSRIEVPINSLFSDLKYAIKETVKVHEKEQKLFYDGKYFQPINFPDTTHVTKLNLK